MALQEMRDTPSKSHLAGIRVGTDVMASSDLSQAVSVGHGSTVTQHTYILG